MLTQPVLCLEVDLWQPQDFLTFRVPVGFGQQGAPEGPEGEEESELRHLFSPFPLQSQGGCFRLSAPHKAVSCQEGPLMSTL